MSEDLFDVRSPESSGITRLLGIFFGGNRKFTVRNGNALILYLGY